MVEISVQQSSSMVFMEF